MRKYAGPGIVALIGLGQSVSGLQNTWIGIPLMALGGVWALQYVMVSVRDRRRHTALREERPEAVVIAPAAKSVDQLAVLYAQGEALRLPSDSRELGSFLGRGEYQRHVRGWARRVEDLLREDHESWFPVFHSASSLPDPITDPTDNRPLPFDLSIPPADVTAFLDARLAALGEIVGRLRDA